MPIYTKTGDRGETSLFGGKRVPKCEELVDVYGSIDELNSWIGLVAAKIPTADVREFLVQVQRDLLTLGSALAGWETDLGEINPRVVQMEARIDAMEKELPELKNFIVPGGTDLGSQIHIVRAICRRVERQAVGLFRNQSPEITVSKSNQEVILIYLNRLSDLLFMLARFINKLAGINEEVWKGSTK